MPRSHPPTLLKLAERTLRDECALPDRARVLVAVSGGGDSQALLDVLAHLASRLGLSLHAHGVDHGLRPEAARELELAAELASRRGVPFTASKLRVAAGGNLQARARAARRAALVAEAARVGADLIATGHHADDRAETVLERLLRGAGPRGLAVLPPRSSEWIRPLIRARRTDVQVHLERHRLRWATDPSNEDPRFVRTRVRREVLPLLEALCPRIVEHLTALADELVLPAPPELRDGRGHPVALGRAQMRALLRMQQKRDFHAEIALGGGRRVRLDRATGEPRVLERPEPRRGFQIREK
jgi:tRNA(Ile)-lysidine synthase